MAKKDFFKAFMAYKYFTKKKETENQDKFPIYETDGGFYHKLREWLDRNDIVEYKYNDKPILQREIEYRW